MTDHPVGYATVSVDEMIKYGEEYFINRNKRIESQIEADRVKHSKKWYAFFVKFDETESRRWRSNSGAYWAYGIEEALDSAKALKSRGIETIFLSSEILSSMHNFYEPQTNTAD